MNPHWHDAWVRLYRQAEQGEEQTEKEIVALKLQRDCLAATIKVYAHYCRPHPSTYGQGPLPSVLNERLARCCKEHEAFRHERQLLESLTDYSLLYVSQQTALTEPSPQGG